MRKLAVSQKYRICQVIFGIGFLLTLFWIKQMGWLESPHHNKVMFGLMVATVLITIPFGLGFYYYRAKLSDADTGLAAVEVLGHAGEKQPQQSQNRTAEEEKHL